MINLYFYLTGALTAFLGALLWIKSNKISGLKQKIKNLEKNINDLSEENNSLKAFKQKRTSKERKAVIIWDGWHKEKDPSYKWPVTFDLTVIASSESNPNLYQFWVDSIVNANKNPDSWGLKEYGDYFYRETNGGWMDISKISTYGKIQFTWVLINTKEDIRDDKLEQLGI